MVWTEIASELSSPTNLCVNVFGVGGESILMSHMPSSMKVRGLKEMTAEKIKIPSAFLVVLHLGSGGELNNDMSLSDISMNDAQFDSCVVVDTNRVSADMNSGEEERQLMALDIFSEFANFEGSKLDQPEISILLKAGEGRNKVRRRLNEVLGLLVENDVVLRGEHGTIEKAISFATHRDCLVRRNMMNIIKIVARPHDLYVESKLIELFLHDQWYVRHTALLTLRALDPHRNLEARLTNMKALLESEVELSADIESFIVNAYEEFSGNPNFAVAQRAIPHERNGRDGAVVATQIF